MTTSRRLATGAIAGVLVVAACTGQDAAPTTTDATDVPVATTPTTTAPTTGPTMAAPTPSATGGSVDAPTPAQLADLLATAWNAAFTSNAPATGAVPDDVQATIDAAIVAGSPAAAWLGDQAALAFDEVIALRGDVVVEALGDVTVGDGVASLDVCTSTLLDSSDPDVFPGTTGAFITYDVDAVASDGRWRLQRVEPVSGDADGSMPCAPPSISGPALGAWEDYVVRYDQYWQDPTDEAAARALSEVSITDVDTLDPPPFTVQRGVPPTEAFAVSATRDSVRIAWCEDPQRDPEGVVVGPDGAESPFVPTALVGTFVAGDGTWLSTGEPLRARTPDLEDPALSLAHTRCFP